MELRHLKYFIAVADEMHFGRAAQKLGIQQPPLSMQIRQLEEEIGTPLFLRIARRIELTEPGRLFLAEAKALIRGLDESVERTRRAAAGEYGRLRIGMINSAPFHPLIPRILREYRELYPKVSITIEEASTPELADRVRSDRLDVAFLRPLLAGDDGLNVERLFDESIVVALPHGHPLAKRKKVPMGALSLEPFVLFSRPIGSGLYDDIIAACKRAGFSPRVVQEALQVTSIVNLVATGLGVSLVPASMQAVHSEGIVFRAIAGDAPSARMSLACRSGDGSLTAANLRTLARSLARTFL